MIRTERQLLAEAEKRELHFDMFTDEFYPEGEIYLNANKDEGEWGCSTRASVHLSQSSYCCGLPEVGSWEYNDDEHASIGLVVEMATRKWRSLKGYMFTTVTPDQKPIKEALERAGWKLRVEVKSNHGDYPIWMYEYFYRKKGRS